MKQVGNKLKVYTHPATGGMVYRWFASTPTTDISKKIHGDGAGFYFYVTCYGIWRNFSGYKKSGMVKGFVEVGDV